MTEYGLAPVNSDPRLTVAATPGAIRNPGWLAPEIINPFHNDDGMPVTESKAADVFAFAMITVEVFTGEAPFAGQIPTKAAFRVLGGERPEMPQNAQQIGLTSEMWMLLEDCWDHDPQGRPTAKKILRKWKGFVEH